MNNKDLFNAIDKAAEGFSPELLELIDGERPVILRAEKPSKKKTVRNIMLGVGGAAAAAAVCVCVFSGIKGRVNTAPSSSMGTFDQQTENDVFRVRDMGLYISKWSSEDLENFDKAYREPMTRVEYEELIRNSYFSSSSVSAFISWRPDVYFYNGIAIDRRMLSDEAFDWFQDYAILTEEEAAAHEMPDYVKYLLGKGFVRFGDLGFLEEKYTAEELEDIKEYVEYSDFTRALSSVMPPQPDVYYYNDIAYNLDQVSSKDARYWLMWYCWLNEETQAQLSGYVPEYFSGKETDCNSEKPEELVSYKGKTFDVRNVSHDSELYIKWYNSLPEELRKKVWYEPQELSSDSFDDIPEYQMPADEVLPVDIIGADGEKLTYGDLEISGIFGPTDAPLEISAIGSWDMLVVGDLVYLEDPETGEFRKYHVGDEINGLRIMEAHSCFYRSDGYVMQYRKGYVTFDGELTVDIRAEKRDTGWGYDCAVSGLPVMAVDLDKFEHGVIVSEPYGVNNEYFGELHGEDDRLYNAQGTTVNSVKIKNIRMEWHLGALPEYVLRFRADLCEEPGSTSAIDWANDITTFPVKDYDDIITVNWSSELGINEWDPVSMKNEMFFLKQAKFLTEYGADVYSVDGGEVVETGYRENDYGNFVSVKYGEHIYVTYGHLSDISVNVGDKVSEGQTIGHAGKSGWYASDNRITSGCVDYHFSTDLDWLHAPIETGVPGYEIPET